MSKPASLRREALAELVEAATWYENRAALGSDIADEVERVRARIAEAPDAFPEAPDVRGLPPAAPTVRQALLRRFPYRLVYIELPGSVLIVAVAHLARRPGYWRGRLG